MATDDNSSNSDSGPNSDSGSNSDGGSNNSSGSITASGSAAIDDLTTNINQIKKSGKPDIKLSTETRDKYLGMITGHGTALMLVRAVMNSVGPLDNPGTLPSALQTKANLEADVTSIGGIHEVFDKYLAYLDAFEATVKKAADRLIQSG
jgi:hypothetical protein